MEVDAAPQERSGEVLGGGGGGRRRNEVLARKILFVYSGQYYLFSPSQDYSNLLIMITGVG